MSKILIDPTTKSRYTVQKEDRFFLTVSEMFSHTLQGEGRYIGYPSVFIRLKECTLACTFCDSTEVWRKGSDFTFNEICERLEEGGAIDFLRSGAHLIWTGGSPLLQQSRILNFIHYFSERYHFEPFMEIENECVIVPKKELSSFITQWNNSPKLSNSLNEKEDRYVIEVFDRLKEFAESETEFINTDFKFVISNESDWEEICENYLKPGLIRRDQIILMPEGETQKELSITRPMTAQVAIREGVRFSDRLHITLWDKKTGV